MQAFLFGFDDGTHLLQLSVECLQTVALLISQCFQSREMGFDTHCGTGDGHRHHQVGTVGEVVYQMVAHLSHTLDEEGSAIAIGRAGLFRRYAQLPEYVGSHAVALTPTLLEISEFFLEHQLAIAIAGSQLEILVLHSLVLFLLHEADVFLLRDDFGRNLRMF